MKSREMRMLTWSRASSFSSLLQNLNTDTHTYSTHTLFLAGVLLIVFKGLQIKINWSHVDGCIIRYLKILISLIEREEGWLFLWGIWKLTLMFFYRRERRGTHTHNTHTLLVFGCSRFTRHFFGKSDSSAWISLSWGQQQDFEAFHGLSGKVIKHSSDFSLKLTALARRPLTSTHHLPSINHYTYSTIFISKNTLNTYFPRYIDMI